jgi:hypothetical protein
MLRIRLIGTVNIPPVFGHDGHIIEVTPENQDVVDSLVLCGSAKVLKEADEVIATATGPQLEKLPQDQLPKGVLDASKSAKLTAESAVADLATREIHGRYIKALNDAGCVTVADVVAKGDKLADIPGISEAAAKKIADVLKAELVTPAAETSEG